MEQTLLLNATFEPLKVVHWQKAITLWCQGKVEIIASHDREVRAVSFSLRLPSVIRLLRYVRIRKRFDYVPFSRANIYARDAHTCQVLQHAPPHAGPDVRSRHPGISRRPQGLGEHRHLLRGVQPAQGRTDPRRSRMHLVRPPRRPDSAPAIRITIGLRRTPDSWRDYLYWNLELDDESG